MMWGWGNSWESWVFGGLMMLLFWGGIAALVVFAFRGSKDDRRIDRPNAREILEERYAQGEISKDEFEERRQVLEHAAR